VRVTENEARPAGTTIKAAGTLSRPQRVSENQREGGRGPWSRGGAGRQFPVHSARTRSQKPVRRNRVSISSGCEVPGGVWMPCRCLELLFLPTGFSLLRKRTDLREQRRPASAGKADVVFRHALNDRFPPWALQPQERSASTSRSKSAPCPKTSDDWPRNAGLTSRNVARMESMGVSAYSPR